MNAEEILVAEFRAAQAEIDAAYWRFCFCRRAYAAAAIGAAWLVASYVVDCEAWLVRARAALGGGE